MTPGSGPISKVDKLAFQSPRDLLSQIVAASPLNYMQIVNTRYEFHDSFLYPQGRYCQSIHQGQTKLQRVQLIRISGCLCHYGN